MTEENTMSEEELKEYATKNQGDYITVDLIEKLEEPMGVIMPGHKTKTFTNEKGEEQTRPCINVSINEKVYEWSMGKKAVAKIGGKLGYDINTWVGHKISLFIDGQGQYRGVNAVVIIDKE